MKFYPYKKKGGGADKVLTMLNGDTQRLGVGFYTEVLAILKGGGGEGRMQKVSTRKMFYPV